MSFRQMGLFMGPPLSEVLVIVAGLAMDKLATWPPDDLLNTAEADVTKQLISLAAMQVPSVARDEARLEPPREVTVAASYLGQEDDATVTRFTLVVPVIGNPSLLWRTASRSSSDAIRGMIYDEDRAVRVWCDSPDSADQ